MGATNLPPVGTPSLSLVHDRAVVELVVGIWVGSENVGLGIRAKQHSTPACWHFRCPGTGSGELPESEASWSDAYSMLIPIGWYLYFLPSQ
jgi:hypothetical protein